MELEDEKAPVSLTEVPKTWGSSLPLSGVSQADQSKADK